MLFSSPTFPVRHVIVGQYIGIGLLVSISALGSFIFVSYPRVYHRSTWHSTDSDRSKEVSNVQKEK